MILPNDTMVAVADGEKLRLFRNKGMEPHIELAEEAADGVQAANQGSGGRHRSSSANPDGSSWTAASPRCSSSPTRVHWARCAGISTTR
jgi:protein required for attachment to host cells